MREKILLLASLAFLGGSVNHAIFVSESIAQTTPSASNERLFAAPQRRLLTRLARQKAMISPLSYNHGHYRQHFNVQEMVQAKPVKPAKPVYRMHPAIDKADIKLKHRLIADEVIKMIPAKCQSSLRNFYVKYDGMEGRGLGGKSTIILNGQMNDKEFRALFIHELGHVIDLGCFSGSPAGGRTRYMDGDEMMYGDDPSLDFYRISWLSSHAQRKEVKDEDFVSGYASWDMFEDFAEAFAYYMLHRDEFVKRAENNSALAAKLAWFQAHLPDLPATAISYHDWDGYAPWDVTKLEYSWQ